MKSKIKILIVASENFNNTYKLKEILYKLSKRNDVIVTTFGRDEHYINKYVWKNAELMNLEWKEFPYYHKGYNVDCAITDRWKFSKSLPTPMYFNIRDRDAIENVDKVFIFTTKDEINNPKNKIHKIYKQVVRKFDITKCNLFYN